jgi:hypothetical protein
MYILNIFEIFFFYDFMVSVEEKISAYRLLVGKPEGKGPLGTLGCRWVLEWCD